MPTKYLLNTKNYLKNNNEYIKKNKINKTARKQFLK